jgi:quercetin dioxygenase-like cupin family protein
MKVKKTDIKGDIIKDNDTYTLIDNNHLQNLTLSKTILKPDQETRGHSHENQEEVYFFHGYGKMQLGEKVFGVSPGSIVLIPKGTFHKVINHHTNHACEFICVFEKYDRESDVAAYTQDHGHLSPNGNHIQAG